MAGFGRAPKPEGQRRNHNPGLKGSLTRLPASGRSGKAPAWPIARASIPSVAKAELSRWERLWKSPQAVAWEDASCFEAVALYVRVSIQAEVVGAQATLLGEKRQMEDRLGLSPMAMLRLRWEIVEMDEAPVEQPENVLDIRERIAAVE